MSSNVSYRERQTCEHTFFSTVRELTDDFLELPSERKEVDCVVVDRLISVSSKVLVEILHSQRYSFVKRNQRSQLKWRSSLLSASPTRLMDAERRLKGFSIWLRRLLMPSNQTGDIGDLASVKGGDLLRLLKLAPRAFRLSESSVYLSREVLNRVEKLVRELQELNLIREMIEPIVESLSPVNRG